MFKISDLFKPRVTIEIHNNSGLKAKAAESFNENGTRRISIEIGEDLCSGGPISRALEYTYGIRRTGR
jgi:hypothetical protein